MHPVSSNQRETGLFKV